MLEDFIKSLEKTFDKFRKDMRAEGRTFIQTVTNKKPSLEQKVTLITGIAKGTMKDISDCEFINEGKELLKQHEKAKEKERLTERIKENIHDPEKQKFALGTVDDMFKSDDTAKKLGADTKELEKIYTSAIEKMIKGTEDFSSITKTLMNDLVNYFAKSAAEAVAKGIIDSTIGQSVNSILSGASSFTSGSINNSVSFVGGLIGSIASLFGSHHSGGFIAQGTGTLPGTSEYLSVLKGGERVLSPAENAAYQGNNNNDKNVVVNNFNVQAWNSKDVQKYLLENKNLIGKITAENIKYNNSNLRYMIGG